MEDISSSEYVSDSEEDINSLLGEIMVHKEQQSNSQKSLTSKASDAQADDENTSCVAIKIELPDTPQPEPQIDKIYSSRTVYSVVCLIDEGNAIYSVPNIWLEDPSEDATNCLWPLGSESNFNKAVEDMTPADEDWDLVPVKVIAQSRTLKGAKAKEKYYESNIDTELNEKKSKATASKYSPQIPNTNKKKPVDTSTIIANKKKQAERRRAEMERPSTSRATICEVPTVLKARHGKRLRDKDSVSDSEEIQVIKRTDTRTDNQIPLQVPGPSSLVTLQDTLSRITAKLDELTQQVQTNTELIHEQFAVSFSDDGTSYELPITSVESLQAFELKLNDLEFFTNLTKYLGSVGGRDGKDVAKRILTKLVDNEFAKNLNWIGRNNKHSFKNYKRVIQLITASIRKHRIASDLLQSDVEEIIKPWLKQATTRDRTSEKQSPLNLIERERRSRSKKLDYGSQFEKNDYIFF